MRTSSMHRLATTSLFLGSTLLASAQDAAPATGEPFFHVDANLLYAMLALAVVQVIFIVALAGIMRTMGGAGGLVKRLMEKGGRTAGVIVLLVLAGDANAQAYKGEGGTMSLVSAFWWLFAINLFLFIILLVQLNILRALTRSIVGEEAQAMAAAQKGESWAEKLLHKLTRRASIEEEKDIDLHHDYDGIRELDNVLPPWWLWLFYGTIAWGVIYLVNMHVINVWQHQEDEYSGEMAQAQVDIAAYMATLTNTVDENTIVYTDDAAVLAAGQGLFSEFCVACHGPDGAGSETSVGPNLTDAYWLHGGGVKNVFKTIKYGVPEKGMISWKSQLQPVEIRSLACYIISLEGKGSPTQKAPQGEMWKEAPSDSTAAPADTTLRIGQDPQQVAMR